MSFPEKYRALKNNTFSAGEYSIVPIRYQDRFKIMQWRNEQIYHLRQAKPLTEEDQEVYFNQVVAKLFEKDKPDQILFSYLKEGKCIGYGGLVHINWIDKNAEISFVLNTKFSGDEFKFHWKNYLKLLEQVASKELKLHKIYTYAFDLRPSLYSALENTGYHREATLKNHCYFEDNFIDVVIHSKILNEFYGRKADFNDAELLFKWVNEPAVRRNSLSTDDITWEDHINWFYKKIFNPDSLITIWVYKSVSIGQSRLDFVNGKWLIDYSIDKEFRGRGFGKKIIEEIIKKKSYLPLRAQVKSSNVGSIKIFKKLGFTQVSSDDEQPNIIEFTHE